MRLENYSTSNVQQSNFGGVLKILVELRLCSGSFGGATTSHIKYEAINYTRQNRPPLKISAEKYVGVMLSQLSKFLYLLFTYNTLRSREQKRECTFVLFKDYPRICWSLIRTGNVARQGCEWPELWSTPTIYWPSRGISLNHLLLANIEPAKTRGVADDGGTRLPIIQTFFWVVDSAF